MVRIEKGQAGRMEDDDGMHACGTREGPHAGP